MSSSRPKRSGNRGRYWYRSYIGVVENGISSEWYRHQMSYNLCHDLGPLRLGLRLGLRFHCPGCLAPIVGNLAVVRRDVGGYEMGRARSTHHRRTLLSILSSAPVAGQGGWGLRFGGGSRGSGYGPIGCQLVSPRLWFLPRETLMGPLLCIITHLPLSYRSFYWASVRLYLHHMKKSL